MVFTPPEWPGVLRDSASLSLFSHSDQVQGFQHWGHLCGVLESTERDNSADLSETKGVTSHWGGYWIEP